MPHGKHIKIIIGVEGEYTIDAINFTGPACHVATLEIADTLGRPIKHQHEKPEARLRERTVFSEREGAR
jgi:hypothetical protein